MNRADTLSIVVSVTDVTRSATNRNAHALPSAPSSITSTDAEWFTALVREAKSVGAELILAGDIRDEAVAFEAIGREQDVPLRIISAPATSLTPELWGLGLNASTRELLAFTINQCVVSRGWARAVMEGFAHGDAGVGGTLELADETSLTGRAIYFLRYSAFLGTHETARREVRDIAGDNAAYRREVLSRHGPYAHGFWEIEAHHWLRAEGGTLALVPGMVALFGGAPGLVPFMRQRFAHGRHFGSWRVQAGGRAAWKIVVAAPLVPLVLLLRTALRVARHPGSLAKLGACVFPFLLLAAAWAAGEAVGGLRAGPRRAA